MEIIRIKEDKLILLLERADMKKYSLSRDSGEKTLKEAFGAIVRDTGIGKEFLSGFLVEVFNSKNGGCEMFVSRIGDEEGTCRKNYIYNISGLENIIGACKALCRMGEEGRLYIDERGESFFLLTERELSFAGEFFLKGCEGIYTEYLREHCREMRGDFVKRIAQIENNYANDALI